MGGGAKEQREFLIALRPVSLQREPAGRILEKVIHSMSALPSGLYGRCMLPQPAS
jgi:hypothetical protein